MLVPRPTSSSKISDRAVALFRMFAVLFISTRNVDSPAARLSDAPTRVKSASTTPTLALEAGTKLPTWASSTTSAVCRNTTLLPAMFGPVIKSTCPDWLAASASSPTGAASRTELGMNASPAGSIRSTTGCRPSTTSRTAESSTVGRT